VSDTEAWGINYENKLSHTTNGGESWQEVAIAGANHAAVKPQEVVFADPRHGWVIGTMTGNNAGLQQIDTFVARTEDGGKHFKVVKVTAPVGSPEQRIANTMLRYRGPQDLWLALGGKSALLKSSDGGKTWRQVPVPIEQVNDIAIADNKQIWVVGLRGASNAVAVSNDAGKSWQDIPVGAEKMRGRTNVKRVFALDRKNVWIIVEDRSSVPYSYFVLKCK
jgi:photosystem II stability/assembly factor-like uncharacterized protein